jgi:site-specific DNA recombinase
MGVPIMRAAIYARVSTDRQNRDQTIDGQLAALRQWVQANGHALRPEHVFTDDGYSGSRLDRPALDRLRDAVREGEIDLVAVLCPDRLARKYAYQVLLLEEFRKAGCEVAFVQRPISADPHDQLLLQIQGAIAEYERAVLGERFRRGKLQEARAGHWIAGRAPYGYRYVPNRDGVPGHLVVDEDEANVVRQLYRWLIDERMTVRQILKRLAAGPIRPRSGKRLWSASVVHRILSDPTYTGTAYANRYTFAPPRRPRSRGPRAGENTCRRPRPQEEWIPIPVPAVIDEPTRRQALAQLERNAALSFRHNTCHRYLLRCLLTCRTCGLAMFGVTYRATTRQPRRQYYRCHGKDCVVRDRDRPCPQRPTKVEELDAAVWEHVTRLLNDPGVLLAQFESQAAPAADDQADERRWDAQLRRLDREEQRLLDAYQAEALALDELKERRRQIDGRRQMLTAQRDQQARLREGRQTARNTWRDVSAFCERVRSRLTEATPDERQQILQLLIERVIVGEDTLEIRHVIPLRPPPAESAPAPLPNDPPRAGSEEPAAEDSATEGPDGGLRSDGVGPTPLPAVATQVRVHRKPVGRQHPRGRPGQGVEGGPVAVRADEEHRQRGRHGHPQPRLLPPLRPAGLVHVRVSPFRRLVRLRVDRGQRPADRRLPFAHRAERHGQPAQVGEPGADGPLAQPPDPAQVGDRGRPLGAEPAPRLGHRGGGRVGAAARAGEGVAAVVDDVPQFLGPVEHLIHHRVRVVAGEGGGTAAAAGRLVIEDLVGRQDHPLVLAVAGLPAASFAGRRLGWGRLPLWAIGRRRLRRVGRVLVQLGFQVRDAGFQSDDDGRDRRSQRDRDLVPQIRRYGRRPRHARECPPPPRRSSRVRQAVNGYSRASSQERQ